MIMSLRAATQTPDVRLSDPIVQAFNKWVFRPAQLNNQPVSVKVLVGIPRVVQLRQLRAIRQEPRRR